MRCDEWLVESTDSFYFAEPSPLAMRIIWCLVTKIPIPVYAAAGLHCGQNGNVSEKQKNNHIGALLLLHFQKGFEHWWNVMWYKLVFSLTKRVYCSSFYSKQEKEINHLLGQQSPEKEVFLPLLNTARPTSPTAERPEAGGRIQCRKHSCLQGRDAIVIDCEDFRKSEKNLSWVGDCDGAEGNYRLEIKE